MLSSAQTNKRTSSSFPHWSRNGNRILVFGTLLIGFVLSQSIQSSLQLDVITNASRDLGILPSLTATTTDRSIDEAGTIGKDVSKTEEIETPESIIGDANKEVSSTDEIESPETMEESAVEENEPPGDALDEGEFDIGEEPEWEWEEDLPSDENNNGTNSTTETNATQPVIFIPTVTVEYENNESTRVTIRSMNFNETLGSKDKFVAICTAARSRPEWEHMPRTLLQNVLINSIRKTVSIDKELTNWSVRLYVAIDHDDGFWVRGRLEELTLPSYLTVKLAVFPKNNANRIPFNEITRLAYDEGAEYLCRVNDDTEFISRNWITRAVNVMQNQFDPPNVGVVGPLCQQGNMAILTHDFVHRTHMDIFQGEYYPKAFKNWYLDNWITSIYSHVTMSDDFHRIVIIQDWEVKHHLSDTRYKVHSQSLQSLHGLLKIGRKQILSYMKEHHAAHSELIPEGFPLPKQRIGQEQFDAIANVFPEHGRLLVDGVGFDGPFWYEFTGKRVVFVVDNVQRDKFWNAYQYLAMEVADFVPREKPADRNHCGLTYAESFRKRVREGELYDVILVDPSTDDCKLQSSILLAKTLATKQICQRNRTTHVFIDDYHEERVRNVTLKYFDREANSTTTRNNDTIVQGYFHFGSCDVVEKVAPIQNSTNLTNQAATNETAATEQSNPEPGEAVDPANATGNTSDVQKTNST